MSIPVNDESAHILKEADLVAEQKMREKFPEIPQIVNPAHRVRANIVAISLTGDESPPRTRRHRHVRKTIKTRYRHRVQPVRRDGRRPIRSYRRNHPRN